MSTKSPTPRSVLVLALAFTMAAANAVLAAEQQAGSAGSYTVTVNVVDQQGQPAAGLRYFLMRRAPQGWSKLVQEGTLAADGTVTFEGLEGGPDWTYILNVKNREFGVGQFQLLDRDAPEQLTFMVPPDRGDMAPDIAMVDLFTGERARLSDYRGQIVYLDFWASWCGPCQEPMAENQTLTVRHKDDWAGKAVIVALSIDDTIEAAQNHVRKKGWLDIRHYWSADGAETGWNSDAPRTYGIDGIPTAFVIDPDGRIVWRGNPNDTDPEKRIERALKSVTD